MASYDQSQDEGYSEAPLSTPYTSSGGSRLARIPQDVLTMTAAQRRDYVLNIMASLPTSEVSEIVKQLRPRLCIDFFGYLPTEICLKVLGFLDPLSLLKAAMASQQWQQLAMDRKLWEQLYYKEGFRVVPSEVRRFEEEINAVRARSESHLRESHVSKRRATPQKMMPILAADGDLEMTDVDLAAVQTTSLFGPTGSTPVLQVSDDTADTDEMMGDQPYSPTCLTPMSAGFPGKGLSQTEAADYSRRRQSAASTLPPRALLSSSSPLVMFDGNDKKNKLNWHHLYTQRRRLEANWESAKYINFQLPHPQFPQEAHRECIYTIQFAGKYLVSGSRDQTLRIWDLETRRLVRPPLCAHTGSVLCLQFDADPAEDMIVSGSSDATIIIWKFSTGQILQRITRAHRESVLNVRFDKRVLVTCSKDKTIKIFNRKPLSAGDDGYPAVGPVPIHINNFGYQPAPSAGLSVRQPFSVIGCLEGHGAAVNAVQIHGDEVVSASGDRSVKVWNWVERTCLRTLNGHHKGIACVQYDGRRIVSGSSDNEVKVFDRQTGVEVASLRAHSNLVRTVQAGFGDLPWSAEEDLLEAKEVDEAFFKARADGEIPESSTYQRNRPRNAGSRKPQDITAYGAKLPPGGGGGAFGRIVSGSYDETIIIWRRDKEGIWRAQSTFRQEDAAQAAEAAEILRVPNTTAHQVIPPANIAAVAGPSQSVQSQQQTNSSRRAIDTAVSQGPTALQVLLEATASLLARPYLRTKISRFPLPTRRTWMQVVVGAYRHHGLTVPDFWEPSSLTAPEGFGTPLDTSPPVPTQTGTVVNQSATAAVPSSTAATAATSTPPHYMMANTMPAAAHPLPAAQHHQLHHHLQPTLARVFKLQFDARRIICCSQMTKIVGWDFANGDEQITEASRFFAPIE